MLKSLSKSKKIIIGASVAGAVGIGAAVVVPLSLKKTKSVNVGSYDEFTKQILKNLSPESYRLWKSNADKALEALNKTMIGNIDIPTHYELLGMFQRQRFSATDSEMRFVYQNQKSGQMVDLVIDVNVKDAISNFEVAIEYGRVNNIDLGKTEISLANEILLKDNGAAEAAYEKREEEVQKIQQLAADHSIKPQIKKARSYVSSNWLEKSDFEAMPDIDGFSFSITRIFNYASGYEETTDASNQNNALSTGDLDLEILIKLKDDGGVPLERKVIRHIKTISDSESFEDIGEHIQTFVDSLQSYDINLLKDSNGKSLTEYRPSQITPELLNKFTRIEMPQSEVFDIKFTHVYKDGESVEVGNSYAATSEENGWVVAQVSATSKEGFEKIQINRNIVIYDFVRGKNLTPDEVKVEDHKKALSIYKLEQEEFSQESLKDKIVFSTDGEDVSFSFFPTAPEKEITEADKKPLTYDVLKKFGIPNAVTLNTNLFDYYYYHDEVAVDGDFKLNFVVTPKAGTILDLLTPADKVASETHEFDIEARGLAKYIKYQEDAENLAEEQEWIDKKVGNTPLEITLDEDLVPQGKRAIDFISIEMDDQKFGNWFPELYAKFNSHNDDAPNYQNWKYVLVLNNNIDTDGDYKFSIEVIPREGVKRLITPRGGIAPALHTVRVRGLDRLLVNREVKFINEELAKMAAQNIVPKKTFSYREINPEAFDDRSSIYSGFYFDSSKITVPGVRNIPLTASVLQQFGISMPTTGDPKISFTFSHNEISNQSLIENGDMVVYSIQVHRGTYSTTEPEPNHPNDGEMHSIHVPVRIMNFDTTINSIKQDELSKYVTKVLNDPKQTPHPIQIYSLIDKIQWNDEHNREVWYALDTSLNSMDVSFVDGKNIVTNQFGLDVTDSEVTGRFFTWLKTFGIITDNSIGAATIKSTLLIRIDPVPNPDGTYNVELRVGRSMAGMNRPFTDFQDGVNTSLMIKANLVNLNEGKVYIEDHKFDELAKFSSATQKWTNNSLRKRITASITQSVDPFKMTLSNSEQLSNFINMGLNVDSTLFNIREFDYDIVLEQRIDIADVRAAQGGLPVSVKITPRLKTHPEIALPPSNVWIDVNESPASIYNVPFDRAALAQEFQTEILDKHLFEVHKLGRLTNNQLLNFDQDDTYTSIYLKETIEWLKNKFGNLPEFTAVGIPAPVYKFSSIWEKDPNVENGFIITIIALPQYDSKTQIVIPSFTLTGKLVLHEHPNSIKSYLGGYVDLDGNRVETRGVMPFPTGTTLTSPIPIPSNFGEVRNNIEELNKYLPTGQRIPHLLDGYVYARKEGDRIVAGVYRNSKITEENKVYEFFIGAPSAATPFGAPRPDTDSSNIYM